MSKLFAFAQFAIATSALIIVAYTLYVVAVCGIVILGIAALNLF